MARLILSLEGGGGSSALDGIDILEGLQVAVSDLRFPLSISAEYKKKKKHPRDAGDLERPRRERVGLRYHGITLRDRERKRDRSGRIDYSDAVSNANTKIISDAYHIFSRRVRQVSY